MLLAAATLVCGCDAQEISDQFFVVSLGFDLAENGQYNVTALAPTGARPDDGGGQQDTPGNVQGDSLTAQVQAPTPLEAFDLINLSLPRSVSFLHIKEIVFSEEVACGERFGELVSELVNSRRLRRSAVVIIVNGSAGEFLKKQTSLPGKRLTKTLETANTTMFKTYYIPHTTLIEMALGFENKTRAPVATYGVALNAREEILDNMANNPGYQPGDFLPGYLPFLDRAGVSIFGAAVFDEVHMVDRLTGYESQLYHLLRGEPAYPLLAGELDIGGERRRIAVEVNPENTRVDVSLDLASDPVRVSTSVLLGGVTAPNLSPEQSGELSREIGSRLAGDMRALAARSQSGGADALGYAELAMRSFATRQSFDAFDWPSKFADAQITFDVELVMLDHGMEPGSLPHPMR